MTGNAQEWEESIVHVANTETTFIKGGTGRPLLVLHEELGYPGWLRWHSALAQNHTLHIPLHPGFGTSPRVEWVSSVRDLAGFYARVLQDMGLIPIDVIGFSLGGWIVAEMAANCAQQFRRMVLVAPAGIRPPEGDIMDMFTVSARAYLNASVHDPAQTSNSLCCTVVLRPPSSSRPGRRPAPRRLASLGDLTCIIPASVRCLRASGACPH